MTITMQPIGYVRSPFATPQEAPRGGTAAAAAEGVLEILAEFQAGLQDIEGFSHLYVLWAFHQSGRYNLLAHPPMDDRPHGVFATRSPFRPNPIGQTVVDLVRREGGRLHVRGLDMIEGTPILDLKPYTSPIAAERLRLGWFGEARARRDRQ